ncbi:hypothetical protein [Amycolatopsis sp. H20-H5]|uniref:hypothetical protein n=1 Tax=Amycolatopsis sp. H20-H5 TaxID=3046309 RepID=UPI002DB59A2A|nr:hypothetical protein [Amycolatopsis sp. H20-H5]MEC3979908.1 hypothetical protein [Amycolatopsis sp. H20-H5]
MLGIDGHSTDAKILLKGVTAAQWSTAMSVARDQYLGAEKKFFVHEPELTAEERRFLQENRRIRANPTLASRLLRRLHLLNATAWIDVWEADNTIKVECSEGPQLRDIAHSLLDPVTGLVGHDVQLLQCEWIDEGGSPYYLKFEGVTTGVAETGSRHARGQYSLLLRREEDYGN